MSSNKFYNPWMPASNGVFGGGSDYNKNAYSVRGRGAANNPWVQGSGWWENSVEGNYQKGFGQATQSNEYYSTEPVSLQAMRRMRTITVLVAGGALVGAAAAAGLFSGGGGAVAAGGTAATTTGGGGTLLGSGTLFAGGGIGATGFTTAQALGTAGTILGGVVGNSLMSSQGASALQGSSGMGNAGNNGPGGNTPMNSLGNPLHPGWPPAQPSGNPQPKTQTQNKGRRRKEESEGEMPDDPTVDLMEQMYRDTMRGYGMRYGGNGSYAKTTGSNGYAHTQNTHPNQNQRPDGDSNEDYTIKRTGRSTDGLREYEVNETLEIIEKRPAHLNNQPSYSPQEFPWLDSGSNPPISDIKKGTLVNSSPIIQSGGKSFSINKNTFIVPSLTSNELFDFMLEHYKNKNGNTVHLNKSILNNLFQSGIESNSIMWNTMKNIGNNRVQVQVNFYKTDYALIFGTATMILELNLINSKFEPVGFMDTFNFDPKSLSGNNQRNSVLGEVLTRIGTVFSGTPFNIEFP